MRREVEEGDEVRRSRMISTSLTQELHDVLVPAIQQLGHAHHLVSADLSQRPLDPLSPMAVAHVPHEMGQALLW